MPAEPKRCIFCQNIAEMTSEHIWGRWTKEHLPRKGNKHTLVQVRSLLPGEAEPPIKTTRAGHPLDASVPVVCGPCNSGWMSRIQKRAKPFLVPLFKGEYILDEEAQRTVSSWITMGAMTSEFSSKPHKIIGVSQAERTAFKETQMPPNGWGVWIGLRQVESWDMQWVHTAFPISDPPEHVPHIANDGFAQPNSQSTAFSMGRLMLIAFSTPFPEIASEWRWPNCRFARTRLHRIWPIQSPGIWGSPMIITDAEAKSIATAFARWFENVAYRNGAR